MEVLLHKVLVSNYKPIVKSIYAEDAEFLAKYHKNAGRGLDMCVEETMLNIKDDSFFYKIEMPDGTLFGFFTKSQPINGAVFMEGFHIRPQFRSKEYFLAFWALVNSTFSNEFYASTGENNFRAIMHLLKNNFTIVNPSLTYNGKNVVIFKSNNPTE